jgi:hypothetical protein
MRSSGFIFVLGILPKRTSFPSHEKIKPEYKDIYNNAPKKLPQIQSIKENNYKEETYKYKVYSFLPAVFRGRYSNLLLRLVFFIFASYPGYFLIPKYFDADRSQNFQKI